MAQGKLGFGCMRLPVMESGEIDHEEFCRMVDLFLEKGFTYFDTSYVYHNGKSESAVREALVKRYPRESYTIATKFPTFAITGADRDKVEGIFEQQLVNCGVDYFDYYLLHNLNEPRYEEICKPCGLFEFISEKKKAGIIKNIGFSFHDSAEVLDWILTEHPEIDFVQIVINYYDWNSYVIQSKECYEVARRHGKQVVVMETVKGGMLANVPGEAQELMRKMQPGLSDASWAVRFASGLDGILAVLSGMSNYSQVEDNTSYMQNFVPMTEEEKNICFDTASLIRKKGPVGTADYSNYENVSQKGLPAAALLDTWTAMASQPNPYFGAEGNYYSLLRYHYNAPDGEWVRSGLKAADGTDITELIRQADAYVSEHAF